MKFNIEYIKNYPEINIQNDWNIKIFYVSNDNY